MDARNQADTIIHSTEKNLKEHGSKISEAEKKAIETAISDLRNALKGTDTEEVKKKTQSLIQASMKLGEAIYQSEQAAAASGSNDGENSSSPAEDGVVDADFEEVENEDDNKDQTSTS